MSLVFLIRSFEFDNKILCYFFTEPHQNVGRFLNTVLALHSLSSEANIITPLSLASDTFPLRNSSRSLEGLHYRPDIAYHTSAILAGTLDSLTLPWRLSSSGARHSMLDVVSGNSSANYCIPYSVLSC